MKILVTGATGYVGGRLVPALLESGYNDINVMSRDMERLVCRPWLEQTNILFGDVFDTASLRQCLENVDIAFYLIHSMSTYKEFDSWDRTAAENFAQVAKEKGVKRIIYLGGLGNEDTDLSSHLKSRHETGKILGSTGIPVTEFRAAIIVGSGSISFEMVRHLTERLPIMICPKWVNTKIQPISIVDVLKYLVASIKNENSSGKIIEIGGTSILSYKEMLQIYAKERNLKRYIIPVPVLTPNLSSIWVHNVTPIPKDISKALIKGLKNEVVVTNDLAQQIFPEIRTETYNQSIDRILMVLESGIIPSTWHDSLSSSMGASNPVMMGQHKGMVIEEREETANCPPENVFRVIETIGGNTGWFYLNFLWKIRGIMDRIAGGVGMRRGRKTPNQLIVGEPLDFWRIEAVEENKLVRLRAEMKVPGKAWLQFSIRHFGSEKCLLNQTAYFVPKGLWGLIYWYSLYPIHKIIFRGMVNKIIKEAEFNWNNI